MSVKQFFVRVNVFVPDSVTPANLSRSTVLMVINNLSGAKVSDQTRIRAAGLSI